MDRQTLFVATALTAFSFAVMARAGDASPLAFDPPRWSIPADTPAQKYAVAMQEAGAALNEALKECRQVHRDAGERKACEAEAREQWKREVEQARRFLSPDSLANR